MNTGYDIIGDIHGQLHALKSMLKILGYVLDGNVYRAPKGRKLISVGDVINKGPEPLECLELVAAMVDAGEALMIIGNHEINAIHYQAGIRPKTAATTRQFSTTLAQIEKDEDRWQSSRSFILSLPTRLELANGQLRVVHAHWPPSDFPQIIDASLIEATGLGGPWNGELEKMVRGPEVDSAPYLDHNGIERTKDRVSWWDAYPADAPFIAFGHYCFPWPHNGHIPQAPTLLGPGKNAVCLDYGAGLGDRLVAMKFPEREFKIVSI